MTWERPQVILPPGLILERSVVARPSAALLVVLSGTLTALDLLPPLPPSLEPPHAATMATLATVATAASIVRLTRDTGSPPEVFRGSSYLCLRWPVSPASQ